VIYFIQQGEDGPIKIGYTNNKDVKQRLQGLQVGNAIKLRVITTIEGDESYEEALHNKFDKYRLQGEWFEASEELLYHIENPDRLRQAVLQYRNVSLEQTIFDLRDKNRELYSDFMKLRRDHRELLKNYNKLLRAPDKMALELQSFVDENRDLKQEIMILRRKLQNWTPPNLKYTKPLS